MRLRNYLTEAKKDKIPTTKKFGFSQDNPMGEWLAHERKKAKSGSWGSTTGRFREPMNVPIGLIANLKGKQGEKRSLSEPRVQDLMASIEKHGLHEPVFINVEYDGHAEINEGNRRTLVAKTLGWKYIPVEISYYAGGELIDGPFHPDRVARVAKKWKKPTTKLPKVKKKDMDIDLGYVDRLRVKREKETKKFDAEMDKKSAEIDRKLKALGMEDLFKPKR